MSEYRDEVAVSAFLARMIEHNGWPEKLVIDKSGANFAGLQNMKWLLLLQVWFWLIYIPQVQYLNNMIEQDHRFIKKLTRPMKGFKSFQKDVVGDGRGRDHSVEHRRASGPRASSLWAAAAFLMAATAGTSSFAGG